MAFLVDEAYLPAILTVGAMTDEAFAQLTAEHPELNLELSACGELIIKPQTYTWTGAQNNEISRQLANWARQDKRGLGLRFLHRMVAAKHRPALTRCGVDTQTAHQRSRSNCLQPLLARVPEFRHRTALAN